MKMKNKIKVLGDGRVEIMLLAHSVSLPHVIV